MKSKLIDALNRIDELASLAVSEGDNKEARQLQSDYNKLFNYINK